MIDYIENEDLSVITPDNMTIPKSEEFGDSDSGRFWQLMRDQIAANDAQLIAFSVSVEQKIAIITARVQNHLDAAARGSGYDGILSAESYANSPHAKFGPEGLIFRDWRDEVWQECIDLLEAWQGGGPELTPDEVIAALPDLVLP